jgi:hypothetical protein
MIVYVVMFEGAFGLQLCEIYSTRSRAEQYITDEAKKFNFAPSEWKIIEKICI